jgi:hypothetical protein
MYVIKSLADQTSLLSEETVLSRTCVKVAMRETFHRIYLSYGVAEHCNYIGYPWVHYGILTGNNSCDSEAVLLFTLGFSERPQDFVAYVL